MHSLLSNKKTTAFKTLTTLKQILFYIVTSIALLTSQILYAIEEIDKTAAIVGEEIIFQSEVNRKVKFIEDTLKNKKVNKDVLTEQAIESLIHEKIQLSIARKNNLTISDSELSSAIKRIKKNINAQGLSFKKYLEKQALTESEFNDEIEKELIIKKLQQGIINQRLKISELEIDNFINSKAGQEWLSPKFHLGHILLPATEKNRATVKNNAKKLFQLLSRPKTDFRKVAKKYSKGPNAAKGGDMGIFTKDNMPSLFAEKVTSMQRGDITAPFNSDAGIHILKVFDRAGAQPVVITQYETRHILVKVTDLFTEAEAQKKINTLYNRLASGGNFEQIAIENTDDVGTKIDGGYLGWSTPGKFVPTFEKVMQTTPVGTISKPFRTQFGWHILRVDKTRQQDIFEQVKRGQIAQLLRGQRFNDELKLWLQDLREQTYVEILI